MKVKQKVTHNESQFAAVAQPQPLDFDDRDLHQCSPNISSRSQSSTSKIIWTIEEPFRKKEYSTPKLLLINHVCSCRGLLRQMTFCDSCDRASLGFQAPRWILCNWDDNTGTTCEFQMSNVSWITRPHEEPFVFFFLPHPLWEQADTTELLKLSEDDSSPEKTAWYCAAS